jgi:hypothetical protein
LKQICQATVSLICSAIWRNLYGLITTFLSDNESEVNPANCVFSRRKRSIFEGRYGKNCRFNKKSYKSGYSPANYLDDFSLS